MISRSSLQSIPVVASFSDCRLCTLFFDNDIVKCCTYNKVSPDPNYCSAHKNNQCEMWQKNWLSFLNKTIKLWCGDIIYWQYKWPFVWVTSRCSNYEICNQIMITKKGDWLKSHTIYNTISHDILIYSDEILHQRSD